MSHDTIELRRGIARAIQDSIAGANAAIGTAQKHGARVDVEVEHDTEIGTYTRPRLRVTVWWPS